MYHSLSDNHDNYLYIVTHKSMYTSDTRICYESLSRIADIAYHAHFADNSSTTIMD